MKHLRFLEVFYYFFKIFPTALASSLGSLRLDYGLKPRDYLVRSFFIKQIKLGYQRTRLPIKKSKPCRLVPA